MKSKLLCCLLCCVVGCAGAVPFLKTIDNAALILCQLYAVDAQEQLAGMTAEEFCDIKENIQPFIDEALAAKQAAGRKLSRHAE